MQPPAQRMLFASQVSGSQLCCWSGAHEPLPWQAAASVATPFPHVAARQLVVAPLKVQRSGVFLLLSHVPAQTVPSLAQL